MKKYLISSLLAACLIFSWCDSSNGQEAFNANDILGPGTFYMHTPIFSYGIRNMSGGDQTSYISFGPSLGIFLAKYFSLGAGINLNYSKNEQGGDSYSSTTFLINGSLGADYPIASRAIFVVNGSFGYYGVSNGGSYSGPQLGVGGGLEYFVTPSIALGPVFTYTHLFADRSMSTYSIGLDLTLFFHGPKLY